MNKKLFVVFAGKRKGPGSTDAQGFSSNGQFFHYLSKSLAGAEAQFRRLHKGYRVYDIHQERKVGK